MSLDKYYNFANCQLDKIMMYICFEEIKNYLPINNPANDSCILYHWKVNNFYNFFLVNFRLIPGFNGHI